MEWILILSIISASPHSGGAPGTPIQAGHYASYGTCNAAGAQARDRMAQAGRVVYTCIRNPGAR